MEITLEKIELVKDRTGVSYREAKEALEAADGSVVDAIIAIEDAINSNKFGKATDYVADTVENIKELVKKGNIAKIAVKHGDEVVLNLPLNLGIVGAVVAPWGALAAVIASFGFKCKIELTTVDGDVIDVSEKAGDAFEAAKEKGGAIYDNIREKAPGVINTGKAKASELFENVKEVAPVAFEELKDKAVDKYYDLKYKNIEWEIVDEDEKTEETVEDEKDGE